MIDFDLPSSLIAQEPAHPRDSARLLVYSRTDKTITDSVFSELTAFLPSQSTLVLNNSKVEQCRWLFGKLEIFVLQKLDTHTILSMVRPGKKFKLGSTVLLTPWLEAEVLAIDADGFRTLRLSLPHDDERLRAFEHVPLPPYIAQNDSLADEYQTVYAQPVGSKAAPTAGLHFTDELLDTISKEHELVTITLHVGLGTFAPLTPEQLAAKRLHAERYEISEAAADMLNKATHITAVGTTSTRTLESLRRDHDRFVAASGETDILIDPPYTFRAVNALITNFHLPGTSLLLLVEAFMGSEAELLRVYQHAIKEGYRFYSFGDGMLIV
jgi:S-adenosylmethionine:tRNA ribosyltransferase-isomerase